MPEWNGLKRSPMNRKFYADKPCERCGTMFSRRNAGGSPQVWEARRWCSRACSDLGRRKPDQTCKNCGQPFRREHSNNKYCGFACYNAVRALGPCAVDGCQRKPFASNLCQAHYIRRRNHGDPLAGRNPVGATVEERFWGKVEKTGGCWLWHGARSRGYGVFNPGGGKLQYAHRYAYELMRGPIPESLTLDHLCRTPRCLNPDHLEPVTLGENSRRARPLHCKRGHEYTDANMYTAPSGRRMCRPCLRERSKTRNRRHPVGKLTTAARRTILDRDGWVCAYCGGPATSIDHLIPRALRRRHGISDHDQRFLLASCLRDNVRKYTRKLAPPSWADRLHELPGKGWQTWDGGTIPEVIR